MPVDREEIRRLKKTARNALITMHRIGDGASCGGALLSEISLDYAEAERSYDAAIRRLQEIDPAFPRSASV